MSEMKTDPEQRIIHAGDLVQHFKGGIYKVLSIATHTETLEKVVVYECLKKSEKVNVPCRIGEVFVRPLEMFMSEVDKEKYPDSTQKYRMEKLVYTTDAVKLEFESKSISEDMMKQVDHPAHYNQPGRKECIEEMIDKYGWKNTAMWCEMTAFKYEYRAGEKDGEPAEKDNAKRDWYIRKADEIRAIMQMTAQESASNTANEQTSDNTEDLAKNANDNDNRCVVCGEVIPEGIQICPKCDSRR